MKKNTLLFAEQFILEPKYIGSILPSSNYLARKVLKEIDFNRANYIVEFGPGTGVLTNGILNLRKKETMVLIFERNKEFFKLLQHKYKHEKNLVIINDSAESLEGYMGKYNIPGVDYIISGIPTMLLPLNESTNILYQSQKYLKQSGSYITILYSLYKKDLITQYFSQSTVTRVLSNFPPAYILRCEP